MLRRTALRARVPSPDPTIGMSTVDIVRKHCYKTWTPQKAWHPLYVKGAKDCWFWDADGNKYLDMSSQLICSTLGHQNEAVIESLKKQARDLAFISAGFSFETRAEAVKKLLEVVPPGIEKFFFPTAGTAANEAAIKIARFVTGKHKVIARYNTYHGATAMSLALTSDYRHYIAEKLRLIENQGVIHIPEFHPYRPSPLGVQAQEHLEYIEYILANEPDTAAIILEPIVGSNGVLIPPDGYMQGIRDLTKKYGVMLIADEVMSAWGRCGEWFAMDRWKVTPDIVTTAKGISNSVAPLGMVATTREIANFFEENPFCHGHTFESHPMTLAPCVAAINEFQRMDLIPRSRVMGAKLGAKLKTLKEKHPSVGDIRGDAMFWCIDLTKNRKTNEPFATNLTKAKGMPCPVDLVAAKLMSLGVYVITHVNMLNVAPPLIINEEEMDIAVAALDEALKITDAMVEV